MGAGGMWEISCLSFPSCCEPKSVLKKRPFFKKMSISKKKTIMLKKKNYECIGVEKWGTSSFRWDTRNEKPVLPEESHGLLVCVCVCVCAHTCMRVFLFTGNILGQAF